MIKVCHPTESRECQEMSEIEHLFRRGEGETKRCKGGREKGKIRVAAEVTWGRERARWQWGRERARWRQGRDRTRRRLGLWWGGEYAYI